MAFTYPGVYIEELPSSVRTIAGVGTSIGLFVGRTARGQLGVPTRILNPTSFGSTFSWDDPGGDLPRAVRLFFANGGSDCYVMRIAAGAKAATVTLNTEASTQNNKKPSLTATAVSAGLFGNTIRLAVNYRTLIPESTFNLEAFVASQDAQGNTVTTNKLRISVDSGPFIEVDLSSIVVPGTVAAIATAIQGAINNRMRVGSSVTTTIGS